MEEGLDEDDDARSGEASAPAAARDAVPARSSRRVSERSLGGEVTGRLRRGAREG